MSEDNSALRRGAYGVASCASKLAGGVGAAGVAVGDGEGYLEKVAEGCQAIPDLANYAPGLPGDLYVLNKLGEGVERLTCKGLENKVAVEQVFGEASSNGVVQFLRGKYVDIMNTIAPDERISGTVDVYDGLKDLDLNGLYVSGKNLVSNCVDSPIETVAAATTLFVIGAGLSYVLKSVGTKGGNTSWENFRNSGRKKIWDAMPDVVKKRF